MSPKSVATPNPPAGTGPSQSVSKPPPGRTILFSGHDFRFLRPFIQHCQQAGRYGLLFDEHRGHEITDPDRCRALLPAADVIFCEWCLGNAVWYSQHKLPRQRLLVRLHLQEMRLPYLDRVRWDQVDALILICPLNLEQIRARYPFLRDKTCLIFNPIDAVVLDQPKLPGAEFNLGLMGICPMRKAPHLAVEILTRLKQRDRRFTLFIKSRHPRDYDWLWRRPEERAYYEKLFADIERSPHADSVVFETYGDDVPLWFSKVGFILSTSDFEGSHQAVAEGMASGAIPIIRNWPGAGQLYPTRYIVHGVEAAVKAILKWKTADHYEREAAACRAYAREQFDQGRICRQLEALCNDGLRPVSPDAAVDLRSPLGSKAAAPRSEASVEQTHSPARRRSAKAPLLPPPPVLLLAYLPAGFRGGYRIRIEQELQALVRSGGCVHLACLHPPSDDLSARATDHAAWQALGVTVHPIASPRFFDIQLQEADLSRELESLQRIVEEHGLRILHAEALYCARIGLFLKRRCPSLRLVFDCHGASPEEERLGGAHPVRVTAMEQWERRVLAEADLNVFVSEAMNGFYQERYGFDALRHVVVPCCVAEERFPRRQVRCPLALPPRRPVLAYVGTLAAWQCGPEMIRLFARLHRRDPELFFLLLVPAADHAQARTLLQAHELPNDALLLAELPHAEVAPALQRAHAGVLLRRAHPVNRVSSPTKFGEYLAAGLPVIMTGGIGDFSRVAAEKCVGLVLRPDLLDANEWPDDELDRIVAFVRRSRRERAATARRCQAVARAQLHWDAAIAALSRAYAALDGAGQTVPGSPAPPAPSQ